MPTHAPDNITQAIENALTIPVKYNNDLIHEKPAFINERRAFHGNSFKFNLLAIQYQSSRLPFLIFFHSNSHFDKSFQWFFHNLYWQRQTLI